MKKAKKSKPDDKYNHFVRLRIGLKDHIVSGKMQGRDLGVYVALHLHADYRCGMVYHISAPYLATFLRERVHKIRRSLSRLEKAGYIKRFGHRGQVSGYDILIDRYLLLNCILIDAAKSKPPNRIAWTVTKPCKLIVSKKEVKCFSSVFQVSPIVDIIDIRVIDNKSRGKGPPAPKSFSPPKPEQVKEYAESIGFPEIDSGYFCEYYEANDWRKKDGEKLRSWKQAVVTWKKNHKKDRRDQEPQAIPEPAMPTEEQLAIATKD